MKTFIIICCIFVAVVHVESAPLSGHQKQKLEQYHKTCLEESKVNEVLVEKARKGIYTEDPAFKAYLFCFSQKIGFQNTSGTVQKYVFQRKISGIFDDKTLVSKLVEQCTVQRDTPQDTSINIAKCLRELAPGFEIFKVTPEIVYVPNEKAQKLFLDHKACAAQDTLDDEVIEQARRQGILFEDPKFRSYIYCFLRKQRIQREDGSLDRDAFYNTLGKFIDDKAVTEKLAQLCLQSQGTPEDTAFFFSKCFHENSPVYIELFPREIPVPDDIAKLIIEHGRACSIETEVDKEILEKSHQGIFSDDPKLKEYVFCMAKKAGFSNDAGDTQLDVLKEKTLKLIKNPAVVQKLIDQCVVKKETPQDTALFIHICFYKNSPGHLSITQSGSVSQAQTEKRSQIIKECATETGVSSSVVLKARKGDFQDDPLLKQYFFCIIKKSGILNETGEYYKNDVIRKNLSEIFNDEEADRLIGKCTRNEDSPLNTSFEVLKCVYKEVPEATVIF